jgi:chemotaxis protein histidine kinase CheA
MSDDAAIVKEFLVESYENLDRLDQDLVVLEKDPTDRNTLASIFRTIHTIKGTSGFLAFNQLEAVTHAGESLLSRLRDGLLPLTAEITTAMLATVDAVREMLTSIEASGKEGERNDQDSGHHHAGHRDARTQWHPDAAGDSQAVPKTAGDHVQHSYRARRSHNARSAGRGRL